MNPESGVWEKNERGRSHQSIERVAIVLRVPGGGRVQRPMYRIDIWHRLAASTNGRCAITESKSDKQYLRTITTDTRTLAWNHSPNLLVCDLSSSRCGLRNDRPMCGWLGWLGTIVFR